MLDTSVFSGRSIALPATSDMDVAARLIRQHGGSVQRFAIVDAEGATGAVERWLSELAEHRFDDVVFLTAQSVRLLIEFARQLDREEEVYRALGSVRKLASGPKVVLALEECGLKADFASPVASADSLLLAIKDLRVQGRTIGVASLTPDMRLVQTLEGKGASVRVLSGPSESDAAASELMTAVLDGAIDAIAFSAPEQCERLFEVARARGTLSELASALSRCHVAALTDAVATSLTQASVTVSMAASRGLFVRPQVSDLAHALGVKERGPLPERPSAASGKRRVVVIGNGMVGYKFCERLTEYDPAGTFEIVAFCEEPRPAYDRVQLTSYFEKSSADELLLAGLDWYKTRGIRLLVGERAVTIDRERKAVRSSSGEWFGYDVAVLCTGSVPFVPPIPGTDKPNVFVYRTIEDLDGIRNAARRARRAVVLGGGLLGLEAAKAVHDMGLDTHVVEFAPRLMPRQLDHGAARLLSRRIEELGVHVHVNRAASRLCGGDAVEAVEFKEGRALEADLVVIATGIRARDDIARESRLSVGERGGVIVDDQLRTNDPNIYALGECALHDGTLYGLVAPGYQMADVLAKRLLGGEETFRGTDQSAKLKLLGVDVASFGDPFADANGARTVVYEDLVQGVYKKLVISEDKSRLLGGILVGDAADYARFVQMFRNGDALPESPEELIFGARQGGQSPVKVSETTQICSCNNVTKRDIASAVQKSDCKTLAEIKSCTKAGTGCGGCIPLVTDILNEELRARGQVVRANLCEHFPYTRTELYQIIKIKKFRSFEQVRESHGKGHGCEVCKPAVASILASIYNDLILEHAPLQDTNDRFLANIQRSGLYSVVPRIPGGEITPEKLIALGEVAKKYNLYTKITGGQRIDLFGAQLNQLPDIWEELVNAGFESGHAYGKAMRTVKSCVGSTWCRFGVQDSVGFSIRVENRYKGIRAPHKLKSAVSGCVRECAEAQSKDFGLIATEKGWNVYVCGNGGAKPRHADLLIADVDEETALKYLDRFIMYYIRTADRLTRTSVWLEKLEGGIEYLRDVIINDRLGIAEELEQEMAYLVNTYQCEWAAVVKDPVRRAQFRHFANTEEPDSTVEYLEERGQRRPRDWVKVTPEPVRARIHLPLLQTSWVKVGNVSDFPAESGSAIKYGSVQIAVYNFASRGEWYACQNMCPHMRDMVLARGLIGDQQGIPKVACPQHKKSFSLQTGECLTGEAYKVRTFPVKVENGVVFVELPSVKEVETLLGNKSTPSCATDSCAAAE